MAGLCVLLADDPDFNDVRTEFETKFIAFNELLGDDCSIFSTVSDLFKDASNIADQWARDLKMAVATVITEASRLFNILKDLGVSALDWAVQQIKDALSSQISAFDDITQAVSDMMGAVLKAANAIKMALCDAISGAISVIPPEIVAGSIVVAAVKGFDYYTDPLTNQRVMGVSDVQSLSTKVLSDAGIVGMKDSVINSQTNVLNNRLPDTINSFLC
jgi:hypothetical protein